ncbi:MAG: DUF4388 domain-containing protein [Dehalococcoidia bacterium]
MAEGLTGNLAQMPIGDMVRMLTAAGQSGRLDLADRGDRGAIYLREGAIIHATHGPASGELALRHLMTWTSGAFRFEAQAVTTEATIHRPASELLAEIAAMAAERDAIRRAIPSPDAVLRLRGNELAGPVTVQPLEWQIIVRLGEATTASELVGSLGRDEFTVLRALKGLVTSGLVEVEAEARPNTRPVATAAFFATLRQAAAAALGPFATVIVEEEVAAMGATLEAFPKDQVSALVERISGEIQDDARRVQFQQRMIQVIRQQAA